MFYLIIRCLSVFRLWWQAHELFYIRSLSASIQMRWQHFTALALVRGSSQSLNIGSVYTCTPQPLTTKDANCVLTIVRVSITPPSSPMQHLSLSAVECPISKTFCLLRTFWLFMCHFYTYLCLVRFSSCFLVIYLLFSLSNSSRCITFRGLWRGIEILFT